MEITGDLMKKCFPRLTPTQRDVFRPLLNLAMARFKINTEKRISMFFAQMCQESRSLQVWVENLNYSASRLCEIFPRNFPNLQTAIPYAGQPQKIANKVYANRLGNGNESSGDGWRYRGHSPIQATGKDMFAALDKAIGAEFGVSFVKNPDLLLQPKYGFLASAWIFAIEKGCNSLADVDDVRRCTKRINGGYHGLAERETFYDRFLRFLPDGFKLDSYDVLMARYGHEQLLPTESDEVEAVQQLKLKAELQDTEIETIPNQIEDLQNQDAVETAITSEMSDTNSEVKSTGVATSDSNDSTPTETKTIPDTEPVGFKAKLMKIFASITTGTFSLAMLKEWLQISISPETLALLKVILPIILLLGGLALIVWYVSEKVTNWKLTKLQAEINSDKSRHDIQIKGQK